MLRKTILFFVVVFVLIQPVASTDIVFTISEPSGDLSTVFTLVPTPSSHNGGGGGTSSSVSIQENIPIQEGVNVTPSLAPVPTIIPFQIPTTVETLQEVVGINQTLTKIKDDNILLGVCFITILLVLFLSYVYVIGKRAIERERRSNKK